MTREHPHPDYHAEALALVGSDMPRVVAVSWALADAAHRAYRSGRRNAGRIETVRQYERVRQSVQALPTLGMPENVEARTAILDLLGGMIRRSCKARLVEDQWTTEEEK